MSSQLISNQFFAKHRYEPRTLSVIDLVFGNVSCYSAIALYAIKTYSKVVHFLFCMFLEHSFYISYPLW